MKRLTVKEIKVKCTDPLGILLPFQYHSSVYFRSTTQSLTINNLLDRPSGQ